MKRSPLFATACIVRSRRILILLGMILCTQGSPAGAQTATTLTYTNRSRPVLRAVLDLSKTYDYSYVITYEDPIYVYPGDLSDVTSQRNITPYSARRILIPLGGSLQLPLPGGSSISQQGMYTLLQQLVESWNDSSQGGSHFQVEEDSHGFHIVPTEVRDTTGSWRAVVSIMDDLISLPTESRTEDQMFQAICDALSFSANVHIYSLPEGGLIIGHRSPAKYTLGATDESAESVMTRAFKMLGQTPRAWYLLYDPTMHAYYMNINRVVSPNQLPPVPLPRAQPSNAPAPAQSPGCGSPSCAGGVPPP